MPACVTISYCCDAEADDTDLTLGTSPIGLSNVPEPCKFAGIVANPSDPALVISPISTSSIKSFSVVILPRLATLCNESTSATAKLDICKLLAPNLVSCIPPACESAIVDVLVFTSVRLILVVPSGTSRSYCTSIVNVSVLTSPPVHLTPCPLFT